MMKWAILIITFLVMISSASAFESCQDIIRPYEPCKMQTPSLNCALYNYTIFYSSNGSIAEIGNLTLLNSDIYYFNLSLNQGDYIIELCDLSTREIKIEPEDNMLAIIIGMGILITILVGLGFINLKTTTTKLGFWTGFFSFSLAIIEVITILGLLLARESGKDIVPLLQINFYAMLVLGFGVFMITMISITILIMKPEKAKDTKWADRWES